MRECSTTIMRPPEGRGGMSAPLPGGGGGGAGGAGGGGAVDGSGIVDGSGVFSTPSDFKRSGGTSRAYF